MKIRQKHNAVIFTIIITKDKKRANYSSLFSNTQHHCNRQLRAAFYNNIKAAVYYARYYIVLHDANLC